MWAKCSSTLTSDYGFPGKIGGCSHRDLYATDKGGGCVMWASSDFPASLSKQQLSPETHLQSISEEAVLSLNITANQANQK